MDNNLNDINISVTCASYSGNKGAAAMLQSSIGALYGLYGHRLNVNLMSVYPSEDKKQNPNDFVNIINAKPEKVVFLEFPLAILYFILKWIPGMKKLFRKNKMIRAYCESDAVIDEAGISFVDSRGFVMNTYAFITMAIPKLLGVPVIKYSQALGSFDKFWNRFLAKMILPKLELICARGQETYNYLEKIGISKNVRICADGAFTMEDDPEVSKMVSGETAKNSFFNSEGKGIVGVSISSVVDSKCKKLGIDYRKRMVSFIDYLRKQDFKVLIIANAAREYSSKPRNNDLLICDSIYEKFKTDPEVCWIHKEMSAEEIREYIGKCRFVVASRFHTMIGALCRRVPVLLIGWSHKYREVLDMFGLSDFCVDYRFLRDSGSSGSGMGSSSAAGNTYFSGIEEGFDCMVKQEDSIHAKIDAAYNSVIESSKDNIRFISEIIEKIISSRKKRNELIETGNPIKYLGYDVLYCRRGYASDEGIRKNAASGGVVTALLISLLKQKKIDGAFVTKMEITEGRLSYKSFIATTEEEIRSCSSSVYLYIPLLKELEAARSFEGRLAVVLTPCMLSGLNTMLERDEELRKKIVLKIGLFCSGNQSEEVTLFSLAKAGVSLENAAKLYYRRGFWRGKSSVIYEDGTQKDFSYKKTICAYKNAYYFEKPKCMLCQDQFANNADISFGDIWLKKMKKEKIKNTCCIIRTEAGRSMYESCVDAGAVIDRHISIRDVLMGQKRALVFKYNAAAAKFKYYSANGKNVKIDTLSHCKWNHAWAFRIAERDRLYSEKHPQKLIRKPMLYIYLKMCFIRFLLSF